MNSKRLVKVLILLSFTCLIVSVPPMPNLYTFIINCLGYTVSVGGSAVLIYFLCTRPTAQKYVLNRLLILCSIIIQILSRRFIVVSFASCFWNSQLLTIVETNPRLVTFMTYRYLIICGTSLLCML